nr:DUF3558 family protein [Saccharopolyspora hordei]
MVVVAGCSSEQPQPAEVPSTSATSAEESATESEAPSMTREVPPEQRVRLAELSAEQLCGLLTPADLEALAFPAEAGQPREIDPDPPTRGCRYDAVSGGRSVLVAAQRAGFAELGREEVDLGGAPATRTLRASDCTVYVAVTDATLQVSVAAAETDVDDCRTAERVAAHVVPALVR